MYNVYLYMYRYMYLPCCLQMEFAFPPLELLVLENGYAQQVHTLRQGGDVEVTTLRDHRGPEKPAGQPFFGAIAVWNLRMIAFWTFDYLCAELMIGSILGKRWVKKTFGLPSQNSCWVLREAGFGHESHREKESRSVDLAAISNGGHGKHHKRGGMSGHVSVCVCVFFCIFVHFICI